MPSSRPANSRAERTGLRPWKGAAAVKILMSSTLVRSSNPSAYSFMVRKKNQSPQDASVVHHREQGYPGNHN